MLINPLELSNGDIDVSSFLYFHYATEKYWSSLADFQLDRRYTLFIDEKTRWSLVDDPTHCLRKTDMISSSSCFIFPQIHRQLFSLFFFSLFFFFFQPSNAPVRGRRRRVCTSRLLGELIRLEIVSLRNHIGYNPLATDYPRGLNGLGGSHLVGPAKK